MIDTVSLTIQKKDFAIKDHKRFHPSTRSLFEPPYVELGSKGFYKCTYNPTTAETQKYKYLPRLTVIKAVRRGGFSTALKVEFSAPKLLYGNNFDELEEPDFGEVCWKLKKLMHYMGVDVRDVSVIMDAELSAVHYSKNIILTDYSTPYTFIKEVAKVNVSKLLDLNQTDFRNEGHAIKYHSNEYEVIFYDKIKDLQQAKISEKRAVEKDNGVQLGLFDKVKTTKPFEVLRMEVRLGSKKKIRDVLRKEGIKPVLTFTKLFSQETSKAILLSTINKIEAGYPAVLKVDKDMTNATLLTELMLNNPKLTYQKALAIVGVKSTLQEVGVRDFRKITDKFNKTSWYRLNKEMKGLKLGKTNDVFALITDSINKFEKVELNQYKCKI